MANDVYYVLRAVSKDKAVLERLFSIMNYHDPEYFIYKVFSAFSKDWVVERDGFYSIDIEGTVAWGLHNWFADEEDVGCIISTGYEKDEKGNLDLNKPIKGTAHYIGLKGLCLKLGIGVEVWSEDINMCFQEHVVFDRNGNGFGSSRDYDGWSEEEFKKLTPEMKKEEGLPEYYVPKYGYGSDWGTFIPGAEIFNYEK